MTQEVLVTGGIFPSLRVEILIEEDSIAHTTRLSRQKLIAQYFRTIRKLLKPLGISEPANQICLRESPDARFELFNLRWMRAARHYQCGQPETDED